MGTDCRGRVGSPIEAVRGDLQDGTGRADAKSGDAATISGYLGKSDTFDRAIGEFALAYADQTERDHAKLVAAVKARRIKVLVEQNLLAGRRRTGYRRRAIKRRIGPRV